MIPLTPETHGDLGWSPVSGFAFARNRTELPLAPWEIGRASQVMPVLFERKINRWQALALMGASDGRNAYVARDGRWSADYVPTMFRLYPFCINADGRLCIESGFIPEPVGRAGVDPFFRNGVLSVRLAQTLRFFCIRERGMRSIAKALDLLAEQSALLSRRRTVGPDLVGQDHRNDLFVVDAERFAAIDDGSISTLFRTGALRWLYAHLESLHHLDWLDRRAKALLALDLGGAGSMMVQTGVADLVSAIADDQGDSDLLMHFEGLTQ